MTNLILGIINLILWRYVPNYTFIKYINLIAGILCTVVGLCQIFIYIKEYGKN